MYGMSSPLPLCNSMSVVSTLPRGFGKCCDSMMFFTMCDSRISLSTLPRGFGKCCDSMMAFKMLPFGMGSLLLRLSLWLLPNSFFEELFTIAQCGTSLPFVLGQIAAHNCVGLLLHITGSTKFFSRRGPMIGLCVNKRK